MAVEQGTVWSNRVRAQDMFTRIVLLAGSYNRQAQGTASNKVLHGVHIICFSCVSVQASWPPKRCLSVCLRVLSNLLTAISSAKV